MAEKFENSFDVHQIYRNTYRIVDNGMGNVNMYLLVGSRQALLIDSGYGYPALLDTVRTLTDREVICACTHGHIDHALGAYLFEKAYLHSGDFELYDFHREESMIRSCGMNGIGSKPKKLLKTPGYVENVELLATIDRKKLLPLEHIRHFDLGDRTVSWYPVPGHTPGSVAFVDEENRVVFDGDAAGNGVWLFMPEAAPVESFLHSVEAYRKHLCEKNIVQRYGGHAMESVSAEELLRLQRLCEHVVKKQKQGKKIGFPMRFSVGNARLIIKGRTAMFIKP